MTEKKKKSKPMGPALKRFIKKHGRFPKGPKERREAGTMTKKDKARSRSKPAKKKPVKRKTTKKKSKSKTKRKTSTKKTSRKKRHKGLVFR